MAPAPKVENFGKIERSARKRFAMKILKFTEKQIAFALRQQPDIHFNFFLLVIVQNSNVVTIGDGDGDFG